MSFDLSGLPSIRHAPFSPDEIAAMDWYQIDGWMDTRQFEPFMCDNGHSSYPMLMTKDGLKCLKCGTVQDWILDSTFKLKDGPAYTR